MHIKLRNPGFSLLELVITVAIVLILSGISLPTFSKLLQSHRGLADARRIASQIHYARLRAAATFSRAQLKLALTDQTFQIQVFDKSTGSWSAETSPQHLAPGVKYGFGTISVPAGGQNSIAQTPEIVFNSRSTPVDCSGCPTGTYAVYLSNGIGQYYAVSVSVNGSIAIWQFNGSAWMLRN